MLPLGRYGHWALTYKSLNSRKKAHFFFVSSKTTLANATNDCDESISSRPGPPPIQVLLTESAGRGVFATRKIGGGDTIHTAKPIASHPSLSVVDSVCYYCLRKIGTATNSQAQSVSFCSENCRDQAKAFHEVEMKANWSAFNDYCRTQGLKYPLLVRRLACMVISGAASAECLDILQPANLSTQMILQIEEEFGLLSSEFRKADIRDDKIAFLTKQWYTNVLARVRINAFRIELAGGSYEDLFKSAAASVEAEVAVGNAVYMLPSFYNHDCDPNAHIIWIDNANAKVKALRDIEPGEELRICYIDASMDCGARQAFLSEGFGFQCRCLRCSSGD